MGPGCFGGEGGRRKKWARGVRSTGGDPLVCRHAVSPAIFGSTSWFTFPRFEDRRAVLPPGWRLYTRSHLGLRLPFSPDAELTVGTAAGCRYTRAAIYTGGEGGRLTGLASQQEEVSPRHSTMSWLVGGVLDSVRYFPPDTTNAPPLRGNPFPSPHAPIAARAAGRGQSAAPVLANVAPCCDRPRRWMLRWQTQPPPFLPGPRTAWLRPSSAGSSAHRRLWTNELLSPFHTAASSSQPLQLSLPPQVASVSSEVSSFAKDVISEGLEDDDGELACVLAHHRSRFTPVTRSKQTARFKIGLRARARPPTHPWH